MSDCTRRFKYPPPLPGEHVKHQWSFLTPCQRMIDDANTRGVPLSQEQLRLIILSKLTGDK